MKEKHLPPVHPGRILKKEYMDPAGITQYRLAKDTGITAMGISEIVRGKRSISPETAVRLGVYFNVSPQHWLILQSRYDLEMLLNKISPEEIELRRQDGTTATLQDVYPLLAETESSASQEQQSTASLYPKGAADFVSALTELNYMLTNVPSRYKAMRLLDDVLVPNGAGTVTHPVLLLKIFRVLEMRQRPSMKELSRILNIPAATMTRTVERLVTDGYVERFNDPEDRRIVRVALTETGRKYLNTMIAVLDTKVSSILGALTKQEQHRIIQLLEKVVYS